MASIVRPDAMQAFNAELSTMLLRHEEPGWEFTELRYGARGAWDVVSPSLHIAAHPSPIRQRLGSIRNPFREVAPSAAVSAPGDHLAGAWEGSGVGQHLRVRAGFVAAAFGRDIGEGMIPRRHFAHNRDPDATDTVIANLLGAVAAHLGSGEAGGSLFLETVVLALVQRALHLPGLEGERGARSGLSPVQLARITEAIDAQLLGRPSLLELAALLDVSTRHFCRAFRQSTGLSPHQFILRRRVDLARSLIEQGRMSLTDVAHASGFSSHSQMTATFRKVIGAPPSHFGNVRQRSV